MTKCYGPTGRISRLKNGVQAVVADGLPSNAPAGGNGAVGPHNIAVEGGHLFVTDGLGGNPLDPMPFRRRSRRAPTGATTSASSRALPSTSELPSSTASRTVRQRFYCSGFTAIISIAVGPDGHLYVLQFASAPGLTGPGVLYRIDSGCVKTPVVTDLFTPGGVAFGPDGAAYISQGSILASGGTVWRFELGS